jgi:hypothetical protein
VERWSWIEDCELWTAFSAWPMDWDENRKAELVGALQSIAAYGPRGNTTCVAEDVYAVYSWSFWILVGDAQPGRRRLLPLVWGTTRPTKRAIGEATTQAIEALKAWREAQS